MSSQLWCPWCGKGDHYEVDTHDPAPMFKCNCCGFVGPECNCIRNEEAAQALQDQIGLRKMARRESGETTAETLFYLFTLVGIVVCLLLKPYACMPTNGDVVRATEAQGWSEVKIESSAAYFVNWKGCSDSDSFAYQAVGLNPKGQKTHLVICSGNTVTGKGVTVRTQ
jgi:hypothetical protein